jgi:hypothetical protein
MRTESLAGALAILLDARTFLRNAERMEQTRDRYVHAYLAAARAATAVLTARVPQRENSRRPASVWKLLREAAPEFGDWALLFATHSAQRAAAEAGISTVSEADAGDLHALAGEFVDAVDRSLSWVLR